MDENLENGSIDVEQRLKLGVNETHQSASGRD